RLLARAPRSPASDAPADVRRWLAAAGTAADDVIEAARLASGRPPAWEEAVAAIRERGDPITRRELAVSGDDLRAAGMAPGPRLGEVLDRLLDAVLEDPSLNSRELLLARARDLA